MERVFASDSTLWKVTRERAILLGGPAAAILQVAHPSVAAGVAKHSEFRENALPRFTRTVEAIYAIAFGTVEEAEAMRERIASLHARVQGSLAPVGGDGRYSAFDPEAQYWVLATLIRMGVDAYEHFVGPLSSEERQSFLTDMLRWGSYFGEGFRAGPPDWADFEKYWDAAIRDPSLGAHPVSRELAYRVAVPRPLPLGLLGTAIRFVPIEMLPSPVRERLGFRSTHWTRVLFGTFSRWLRLALPSLPRAARFATPYLAACLSQGVKASPR